LNPPIDNRQSAIGNVLIIGAGVAGLAAARELSRADFQVTVVEARDRIGGRIFTQDLAELGAEFIHGKPQCLLDIAQRAELKLSPVINRHWYFRKGCLATTNEFWSELERVMNEMKSVDRDESFSDFLKQHDLGEAEAMAKLYVEGFHASRAERVSVKGLNKANEAAEAIDDDEQFRLPAGYAAAAQSLHDDAVTAGAQFFLNTIVEEIRWQPNQVEIIPGSTKDGGLEDVKFSRALITLPLGVMQAGSVRFVPELTDKLAAANKLAMGQVVKFVLRFREPFWEDLKVLTKDGSDHSLKDLSFLHAPEELMPTWWTLLPSNAPILIGWAGGSRAEQLLTEGEAAITNQAVRTVATIFGVEQKSVEDQFEAIYYHEWYGDPFARGAYSYIPVGGLEAAGQLAAPVANTLFFAGEATNTEGHQGTVHGAIATGLRAARELIETRLY
jgi:monoamine oxidase